MAEVVNLRLHAKRKARADKAAEATANAAKHGRTKAAREAETRAAERAKAALDAHRLDPKP